MSEESLSIEELVAEIIKNTENNWICSPQTLIEWMHRTISTAMNYTLKEGSDKKMNPELITIFVTEEIITDIIYATSGNRTSEFAFSQSDVSSIMDETLRYVSLMRALDKDVFVKFLEEDKEDGKKKSTKKKSGKKSSRKSSRKKGDKEE